MPAFTLTNGNDTFTGTTGDDLIKALAGWDDIYGDEGNDTLSGAEGDDTLAGGSGDDLLMGEDNDDVLRGGTGDDLIDGGDGLDWADYSIGASGPVDVNIWSTSAQNTGQGWDTLLNIEHLSGTAFNDYLNGNSGDNWIWGAGGSDTINAGEGNDLVEISFGDHALWGSAGLDNLSFNGYGSGVTGGVTVSLSLQGGLQATGQGTMHIEGFEGLVGTTYDDALEGDEDANYLHGNAGDDWLSGLAGDDTLMGDGLVQCRQPWSGASGNITSLPDTEVIGYAPGKDTLDGGKGDDRLLGGAGGDDLYGGDDKDTFVYLRVEDSLASGDRDQIWDLESHDLIDLSAIDADVIAAGDQAFTLVAGFSGTAGELVLDWDPLVGSTFLRGDVDGDKSADFEVEIFGNWSGFSNFLF